MVETCRIGVKNFIKMVKKCIIEGIKIVPLLDEAVSLLAEHIQVSG